MTLAALNRKLVRDLKGMWGQMVTIALVVASGVAGFVAMQATHDSLVESRDLYYREYRFGDAFVQLTRAPESLRPRLEAIDGVTFVDTRVVESVRIPLPDQPQPPVGQVVSNPGDRAPALNALLLREGRMVTPGERDEALLLEAFAERFGIGPGDTIPVVMEGTRRDLRVVGTAASPEYIYPMPPGQLIPDEERFAVLWMDRNVVAPHFQMEGAFNDAAFRLSGDTPEREVLAEIDRVLGPYGTRGAVGREFQPSHWVLEAELAQIRSIATVVPLVFLAVAAFLVNVVLSRLVALQRGEIASLKALGYRDGEIAGFYLKFAAALVGPGVLVGLGLGAWFGAVLTEFYGLFFGLPLLEYRVSVATAGLAAGVSLAFGAGGALASVRRILRLSPAEAMQPEAPARYRPTLLERLGLGNLLGGSGRMVLREVGRRPWRTALSAGGIGLALAIIVLGRFSMDAIDFLMDHHFHRAWREDVTVTLTGPQPERAVRELAALPGVVLAEGMRTTPVRIHSDHRWRDASLQGYAEGSELRRLMDQDAQTLPMPAGGAVLTETLAARLHLEIGDTMRVQLREAGDRTARVPITGTVDEMLGLQGHMRLGEVNQLLREAPAVNTVLLTLERGAYAEVEARLMERPFVGEVTRRDALVDRFREQSAEIIWVLVLILSIFGSVIAAGVVYNNARVALSMRARDLASLRVLGFTRGEISGILLGELAVQVALAIPLGILLGRGMAEFLIATLDPERYRLPVILTTQTYAFAVAVVLLAAAGSALVVRRRLDRLDLIGVLKTRE